MSSGGGAIPLKTNQLEINNVYAVDDLGNPRPADKVLVTNANGLMTYETYNGDSSDWYLYPAGGDVDMSGNALINANSIVPDASGILVIGQSGVTPQLTLNGPSGESIVYDPIYNPPPPSDNTVLLTSGTSYTLPLTGSLYKVEYLVCGGGGGGGGSGTAGNGGGGGGGSGYLIAGNTYLPPGYTLNYTIGVGGAGGAAGVNGSNGTATTLTIPGLTITSNGGFGGLCGTGGFGNQDGNGGIGGNGAAGVGGIGSYGGGGGGGSSITGVGGVGGTGSIQNGANGFAPTGPFFGGNGGNGGGNTNGGINIAGFSGDGAGGGGGGYYNGNGGNNQSSTGVDGGLGTGGGGGCGYFSGGGGNGGTGYITLILTKF